MVPGQLDSLRVNQPEAVIFACTPTVTTDTPGMGLSEIDTLDDLRGLIHSIVAEYRDAGDTRIYSVPGDEITTVNDLHDPVHFSIPGSERIAGELVHLMSPLVAPSAASGIQLTGDGVDVSFSGEANKTYVLRKSSSLSDLFPARVEMSSASNGILTDPDFTDGGTTDSAFYIVIEDL